MSSNARKIPAEVLSHPAVVSLIERARPSGRVTPEDVRQATLDSIRAMNLIRAYRVRGHLIANLDPLGLTRQTYHPDLDPALVSDVVVGCASVFPSAYPEEPAAWQLRGMAVAAHQQGTGLGAQVLLAAVDVVRQAAGPLLWANARVSALGFYERLGFSIVGSEFTHGPLKLPHKVIVLRLREG